MEIVCKFSDYEEMMDFAGKLRLGEDPLQAAKGMGQKPQKAEPEKREPEEKTGLPEKQESAPEESACTLTDVRAKLAELQKSGKREQVKELLAGFGASRLSEVPEGKYAELMKKAGEL